MHDLNIADLLREALVLSGCNDQQIGQFDGHSTIELELRDLPSLNIVVEDGEVWCWSNLGPLNSVARAHFALPLLSFLLEGFAYARTGQMQLLVTDDLLEVRVLLSAKALVAAEQLAEAMDSYVERLLALREVLR